MREPSTRSRRIADQIRRELSMLLTREIADPRVQGVFVNDVEVSRDLAHARIFVQCPQGMDHAECLSGLASAAGYMRRHLARSIRMRHVPEIRFTVDTTLDKAAHMDALIARALPEQDEDGDAADSGEDEN